MTPVIHSDCDKDLVKRSPYCNNFIPQIIGEIFQVGKRCYNNEN
jgi:hypothetical protein